MNWTVDMREEAEMMGKAIRAMPTPRAGRTTRGGAARWAVLPLAFGVSFGAVTLAAGTASAEDKAAADKKDAAMAPPKPAPELAHLKPLEGTWVCEGSAPAGAMGPGSPAMKYKSTLKTTKTWDGFGYKIAYEQKKSKEHPMHFSGEWNVGYDVSKKVFLFFWEDNMGSVGLQTVADWTGDNLVMTGDVSAFGQAVTARDTLTRKGDKELQWKGEMKFPNAPDFVVIGEDTCKKK